jgi:hypothetical protein
MCECCASGVEEESKTAILKTLSEALQATSEIVTFAAVTRSQKLVMTRVRGARQPLWKKLSEAYFSTSKLLLCYFCICHLLPTGDDKGGESKAALKKKLSEA